MKNQISIIKPETSKVRVVQMKISDDVPKVRIVLMTIPPAEAEKQTEEMRKKQIKCLKAIADRQEKERAANARAKTLRR